MARKSSRDVLCPTSEEIFRRKNMETSAKNRILPKSKGSDSIFRPGQTVDLAGADAPKSLWLQRIRSQQSEPVWKQHEKQKLTHLQAPTPKIGFLGLDSTGTMQEGHCLEIRVLQYP